MHGRPNVQEKQHTDLPIRIEHFALPMHDRPVSLCRLVCISEYWYPEGHQSSEMGLCLLSEVFMCEVSKISRRRGDQFNDMAVAAALSL